MAATQIQPKLAALPSVLGPLLLPRIFLGSRNIEWSTLPPTLLVGDQSGNVPLGAVLAPRQLAAVIFIA